MTKYSFQTLLALVAILLGGVSHSAAQIVAGDSATTPTCASWGYRGPSVASPPDGAVYRVGEQVIFETDPEFATGVMCAVWPDTFNMPFSSISRSIDQFGVDGRPVEGAIGFADTPEVLYFNVPGTVTIERRVWSVLPTPRTGWKVNTITIIDDGPRPFPEPVSAPPGEKRPRIEARRWRGNPQQPTTRAVLTEDNSFSFLPWTEVKNTGDAPLVIDRIMHWIGVHHTTVYPVETTFPMVIPPGQTRYIPFQQDLNDVESYVEDDLKFEVMIIVSNDPVRPNVNITHGGREIFPTKADIPEDYPFFAPRPPVIRDEWVCNDTNNDGVIDVGDIVTSILRSGVE